MKLLVDMNLSPRWVKLLADNGFETLHWSTVGKATASDLEIMAWASDNGCVVLTHDLDFSAILAATRGKSPSVVQIRAEDISPDIIGGKIVHALHQMRAELEEGRGGDILKNVNYPARDKQSLFSFGRGDLG